jgi:hypothetical protein
VRAQLERERIVLLAEAIQASVSGEKLRAAGVPKGRALAAFALTQQRLALYLMGVSLVDMTWDSGEANELDLRVVEHGLEIGFDAALVADGRAGRVVVLLRLPDPAAVLTAIEQRRRPLDPLRHVRRHRDDPDA